jgi:alkanesulfonate monooxygenase SsuD/methylene tetrahydromethanopterin reductase-like flavin-dependent oxidoreductase (luciferase family)
MQIGIAAHVAGPEDAQFVRDAERLGVSSAWVAEAWGQDAFTPLAYLAARAERIALGTAIAQLGRPHRSRSGARWWPIRCAAC